ncbi:DUF4214 domain-containing protein [Devosia sp. 1635]|uniref:DUF4214 domain-containing protein n=1 Tax=Devosia sp. 1635 TaxID=2726066 RepID=UPI001566141D|nr:DUF4214 domain-containing protein [Devosia sp. 1635]
MATIQEVYIALFGRPADPAGYEFYVAATNDGEDLSAVGALSGSPEYIARFEGMGDADMVNQIFIDLFGRAADPTGLLFYVEMLRSGNASLQDIAIRIIDGATGVDQEVIENKVAAAQSFTDSLDTAEERAAYSGSDAAAQGRLFLSVVTEDDATIPSQAQVDGFIASIGTGENFDVTVALNTLAGANQAEVDFLASLDLDNDPTTDTTEQDVLDNLSDANAALNADITADGSDRVLNALLDDAEAAQDAVEAEIAEVDGLAEAIAEYEAAVEAEAEAEAAADLAAADQAGEEARFRVLNTGTLAVSAATGAATYDADGAGLGAPTDLIVVNADGDLELADGVSEETNPGVTDLLAAIQARVDADEAEADAEDLVSDETADLAAIDPTDLYGDLVDARDDVEAAQAEVDERAELRADAEEAQELVDRLDAINADIAAAEDAFADLGYEEPVTVSGAAEIATADNDIFLASDDNGSITGFGAAGDDLLYVGQGFRLVELDDENIGTDAVGAIGVQEIFIQQQGANTVLYIEDATFNGSETDGTFDGTTITLTGVSAEDVSFANGYFSIA